MSTPPIALQIPNFDQTRDYLQSLGLDFLGGPEGPPYGLVGRGGSYWQDFDTLATFWGWWMEYAAHEINNGRFVAAFIRQFRTGTAERRDELLTAFDCWLRLAPHSAFDEIEATVARVSADALPAGWEDELQEYLLGEIGGRSFPQCVPRLMAAADPVARARLERLAVERGLSKGAFID